MLKQPVATQLTYLVTVAYEGTHYVGWQVQSNGLSVQQALEDGFLQVTGLPIRLRAAGRTDAGVHALALPADFSVACQFDLPRLELAWNAVIPRDISIRQLRQVPAGFNARHQACRRTYRYLLLNRFRPSPFLSRWCWHIPDKLDIKALQVAVSALIGEHDFSAFRASDCEAGHAIRRIYTAELTELGGAAGLALPEEMQFAGGWEEGLMVFTITGNAFVKHQVRSLVGTLAEVGRLKMTAAEFAEVLAAADRRRAGPTAPAQGLTLVQVDFPNEAFAEVQHLRGQRTQAGGIDESA